MRRLPARHLVLCSVSLALAAAASAVASSPDQPTGPLVAADGHGLSPRFASLADTHRLDRRTAKDGAADTLTHWGQAQSEAEATPEGRLVGRLGLNMATFWMGGYVADRVITTQVPADAACGLVHCFSWKLELTRPAQVVHAIR